MASVEGWMITAFNNFAKVHMTCKFFKYYNSVLEFKL